MSTAERLKSLNTVNVDNIVSTTKNRKAVLSFTPKLIVFQNFKPNDNIVAKFSVKNISKVIVNDFILFIMFILKCQ